VPSGTADSPAAIARDSRFIAVAAMFRPWSRLPDCHPTNSSRQITDGNIDAISLHNGWWRAGDASIAAEADLDVYNTLS